MTDTDMTVDLWCSLLTSEGIESEEQLDRLRTTLAIGPIVMGTRKERDYPLLIFQSIDQWENFTASLPAIKERFSVVLT